MERCTKTIPYIIFEFVILLVSTSHRTLSSLLQNRSRIFYSANATKFIAPIPPEEFTVNCTTRQSTKNLCQETNIVVVEKRNQ